MADSLNSRNVTGEPLRFGSSHKQLFFPPLLYLHICDEAAADFVTLPFDHAALPRRIGVMRAEEHQAVDKLPELRAMGVEMAMVLGAIPRLPRSLSAESADCDTLVPPPTPTGAGELKAFSREGRLYSAPGRYTLMCCDCADGGWLLQRYRAGRDE